MIKPHSNLNIEVAGKGSPLVLIHGWGMHSGLFTPIIEQLKHRFCVYSIDLPGHGFSFHHEDLSDLEQLTGSIFMAMTSLEERRINILGWSLGGLIAQRMAALYQEQVEKLILVSSTACFVNKPDWPFAMDDELLQAFSRQLEKDYSATLDRFLALQFMGASQQKQNLRYAREILKLKPEPVIQALQQGMELLLATDLRTQLQQIKCPSLIIGGEHDTLVPTRAIRSMTETMQNARAYLFKGASHTPFLTHSEEFCTKVRSFLA